MSWFRTTLLLCGGIATGAVFGNACILAGGGDCNCPPPRKLLTGTFAVTAAKSSVVTGSELEPLKRAKLIIEADNVRVEYMRNQTPVRASYAVLRRHGSAE